MTKFLTEWLPVHKLDPNVEVMLRDFVGTKGHTFAKNVITAIRKRRLTNALASLKHKAY